MKNNRLFLVLCAMGIILPRALESYGLPKAIIACPIMFLLFCLFVIWTSWKNLRSSQKHFSFRISDLYWATFCLTPSVLLAAFTLKRSEVTVNLRDLSLLAMLVVAQIMALFVARVEMVLNYEEITIPGKTGGTYVVFSLIAVFVWLLASLPIIMA